MLAVVSVVAVGFTEQRSSDFFGDAELASHLGQAM
jgi:hypothetical protein